MQSINSKLRILIPDPGKYRQEVQIKSFLSFAPYYKILNEKILHSHEQFLEFYLKIIQKLEASPELLQPIHDVTIINRHEQFFQLIASTLFPFSTDIDLQYYALGSPYKFEFFFYSDSFQEYFKPDENGYIDFPPERPLAELQAEYDLMAYRQVFRKYFNIELNIPERSTNQWFDRKTGLTRYSRVHIDESFIDVNVLNELPLLPSGIIDHATGSILDTDLLKKYLPLSLFIFEGFIIRRSIADVTPEECVKEVKNAIIEIQSANPKKGYQKLRSAMETMIGTKNVKVSLNTFLKLNEDFIYNPKYSGKSLLLQALTDNEKKEEAYHQLAVFLEQHKKSFFISEINQLDARHANIHFLNHLKKTNYCCYLVTPLFEKGNLIGMMEAVSLETGVLNNNTLKKLEPVLSYFEMACRNDIAQFENEIESLIFEKYTALLPVVKWKFREEAWKYLKEKDNNPSLEIGAVKFNPVYPVYGAIDVKDSSSGRRICHQKDIIEQLTQVEVILHLLKDDEGKISKESINILQNKIVELRKKITNHISPEDEIKINEFIKNEVHVFLNNLLDASDINLKPVKEYLLSIDAATGQFNKYRRNFDESLGQINAIVSRYLETEQIQLQQIHPHYFEKFRSDGVEYILYLGNPFEPEKEFDINELKTFRLWQLSLMAHITRLTWKLKNELPFPLETTQLILVFNKPISISFRRDERRFDVEGQESVQFEILKKRIDKVKIKALGERLTKPGTIAMVYSNSREIAEYDEYITLLKSKNLIVGEKQMFELEDVQDISGLKALRLNVNLEN